MPIYLDTSALAKLYHRDVRKRLFRVVALHVRHYELAQSLIDNHGANKGLKTLDSLQLAVALDRKRSGLIDCFVTAETAGGCGAPRKSEVHRSRDRGLTHAH